jgi:hypothetical protein
MIIHECDPWILPLFTFNYQVPMTHLGFSNQQLFPCDAKPIVNLPVTDNRHVTVNDATHSCAWFRQLLHCHVVDLVLMDPAKTKNLAPKQNLDAQDITLSYHLSTMSKIVPEIFVAWAKKQNEQNYWLEVDVHRDAAGAHRKAFSLSSAMMFICVTMCVNSSSWKI